MTKKQSKIGLLALFIIMCLLIGLIGKFSMLDGKDTWYQLIKKPSFFPPDYVFGPVWTILYIMIGISLWRFATSENRQLNKRKGYYLFSLQLFFNLIWSFLFFGIKQPFFAFIDLTLLWFAILFTIQEFKKFDKLAAYLLIPYFLWVSYAYFLNFYFFKYLM